METSVDLLEWTTVSTQTAEQNGIMEYLANDIESYRARFYRLVAVVK